MLPENAAYGCFAGEYREAERLAREVVVTAIKKLTHAS
jgi:hypothetical protein